MENNNSWKRIEFSNRTRRRILGRGTRGEIDKAIAELVKNCDDSYYRLGISKESVSEIEIGYWYCKVKKNRLLTGFYVRDWAEGMTREDVKKAYAEYGADTAAEARSGAIGVGGKDALYGKEVCHVISAKDGVPVVLGVRTIEGDIDVIFYNEAEKHIEEVNKNLKRVSHIDVSKNGTIVLFKIPKEENHPRFEKFKERLQNYYTLRNILEDKSRRVRLVDVQSGESHILEHNPI